jgi:predicted DNA-binding protein (MmcQ/YjbR family)
MPKADPVLKRLREICLALPEATETMTWGQPHFRVRNKIFAGYDDESGKGSIDFKLTMDHAADVLERPGFSPAPYVGHKGWVSVEARPDLDWDELRQMIRESFRLIAPKRLAAQMDDP